MDSNNRSSENNNNRDNPVKTEVQTFIDTTNFFDPNMVQISSHIASSLAVLGILDETQRLVPVILEPYDIKQDFDWFASGQVETDSFKGQHIAIWRKQVVGSGETAVEAERIAKAYYGNECSPAIVYIPKDEEVDTIL
jgi:hypothetical protein